MPCSSLADDAVLGAALGCHGLGNRRAFVVQLCRADGCLAIESAFGTI